MNNAKRKLIVPLILMVSLFSLLTVIQKVQDVRRKAAEGPKSTISFTGDLSTLAVGKSTPVAFKLEGSTPITGANLIICYSSNLSLQSTTTNNGDPLKSSMTDYTDSSLEGKKCKQLLVLPVDNMADDSVYLSNLIFPRFLVTKISEGDGSLELILSKSQMSGIYSGGTKVGFVNTSNPVLGGAVKPPENPQATIKYSVNSLVVKLNESGPLHVEVDSEDSISSANLLMCFSKSLELTLNDADKINSIYSASLKLSTDRDGLTCKRVVVLPSDNSLPSSQYLKKFTIASLVIKRISADDKSFVKIYNTDSELTGVTAKSGSVDMSSNSVFMINVGQEGGTTDPRECVKTGTCNPLTILKYKEIAPTVSLNNTTPLHIEADAEDGLSSANLVVCYSKSLDLSLNTSDPINSIYTASTKLSTDRDDLACKRFVVLPSDNNLPSNQYLRQFTLVSLLVKRMSNDANSIVKIIAAESEISAVTSKSGSSDISPNSTLTVNIGGLKCVYCANGLPLHKDGNANCDSKVDLTDFEFWRRERYDSTTDPYQADFDCTEEVGTQQPSMNDFAVWYKTRELYYKALQ